MEENKCNPAEGIGKKNSWQCQTRWVLCVVGLKGRGEKCPWQRLLKEEGEVVYHLHSKASVFCGGEEDEGLIPVSEDAEDIDAPVLEISRSFFFNRFRRLSIVATSDFKDI